MCNELEGQVSELVSELVEAKNRSCVNQEQIQAMSGRLCDLGQSKRAACETIFDLRASIRQKEYEKEISSEELSNLKGRADLASELRVKLSIVKEDIEFSQRDVNELTSTLHEKDSELAETMQRIRNLDSLFDERELSVASLESFIGDIRGRISGLRCQLDEHSNSARELRLSVEQKQ